MEGNLIELKITKFNNVDSVASIEITSPDHLPV